MAATLELKYFNSFWLKKLKSITSVRDTTGTVNGATSGSPTIVLSASNPLIGVGQRVRGTGISATEPFVIGVSGSTITVSSNQTIADTTVLEFGPIVDFTYIPAAYVEDIDVDWVIEEARIRGGYNNTITDLGAKAYVEEDKINQVSITTPPIPINGTLAITYMLTQDIVNCATNVKIGSFGLTFNSPLSLITSTSIVDANNQYQLEMDLPLGYPIYSGDGVNRVQANMAYGTIQQLVSGNFVSATGWYRYGPYTTPTDGLSQTIMKEYINNYRRNLINVDCNLFGITTTNGNFAANKLLQILDTDPAQINIEDNRYMTGNMTIDIVGCETQATLLDISNEELSSTIETIFTVNGVPFN